MSRINGAEISIGNDCVLIAMADEGWPRDCLESYGRGLDGPQLTTLVRSLDLWDGLLESLRLAQ